METIQMPPLVIQGGFTIERQLVYFRQTPSSLPQLSA